MALQSTKSAGNKPCFDSKKVSHEKNNAVFPTKPGSLLVSLMWRTFTSFSFRIISRGKGNFHLMLRRPRGEKRTPTAPMFEATLQPLSSGWKAAGVETGCLGKKIGKNRSFKWLLKPAGPQW